MTFTQFIADSVGHTVVHVDEARGLFVMWYGSTSFLEYWVRKDTNDVAHGSSWSISTTPRDARDAVQAAETHYGLAVG